MAVDTMIKFHRPYERNGRDFEEGEKVEPSDIGMSMDEAEALAAQKIVKIQRVGR